MVEETECYYFMHNFSFLKKFMSASNNKSKEIPFLTTYEFNDEKGENIFLSVFDSDREIMRKMHIFTNSKLEGIKLTFIEKLAEFIDIVGFEKLKDTVIPFLKKIPEESMIIQLSFFKNLKKLKRLIDSEIIIDIIIDILSDLKILKVSEDFLSVCLNSLVTILTYSDNKDLREKVLEFIINISHNRNSDFKLIAVKIYHKIIEYLDDSLCASFVIKELYSFIEENHEIKKNIVNCLVKIIPKLKNSMSSIENIILKRILYHFVINDKNWSLKIHIVSNIEFIIIELKRLMKENNQLISACFEILMDLYFTLSYDKMINVKLSCIEVLGRIIFLLPENISKDIRFINLYYETIVNNYLTFSIKDKKSDKFDEDKSICQTKIDIKNEKNINQESNSENSTKKKFSFYNYISNIVSFKVSLPFNKKTEIIDKKVEENKMLNQNENSINIQNSSESYKSFIYFSTFNFPVVAYNYQLLDFEKCMKCFDYISKDSDITIISSIFKFSEVLTIIFSSDSTIKFHEHLYLYFESKFSYHNNQINDILFKELRPFIYRTIKSLIIETNKKQKLDELISLKFKILPFENLLKMTKDLKEIKKIEKWRDKIEIITRISETYYLIDKKELKESYISILIYFIIDVFNQEYMVRELSASVLSEILSYFLSKLEIHDIIRYKDLLHNKRSNDNGLNINEENKEQLLVSNLLFQLSKSNEYRIRSLIPLICSQIIITNKDFSIKYIIPILTDLSKSKLFEILYSIWKLIVNLMDQHDFIDFQKEINYRELIKQRLFDDKLFINMCIKKYLIRVLVSDENLIELITDFNKNGCTNVEKNENSILPIIDDDTLCLKLNNELYWYKSNNSIIKIIIILNKSKKYIRHLVTSNHKIYSLINEENFNLSNLESNFEEISIENNLLLDIKTCKKDNSSYLSYSEFISYVKNEFGLDIH